METNPKPKKNTYDFVINPLTTGTNFETSPKKTKNPQIDVLPYNITTSKSCSQIDELYLIQNNFLVLIVNKYKPTIYLKKNPWLYSRNYFEHI